MVDLLLGLASFGITFKVSTKTRHRDRRSPYRLSAFDSLLFLDSTQRPQLKIKLLAQRSILFARREKVLKQAHDDLVHTGALALCPRSLRRHPPPLPNPTR